MKRRFLLTIKNPKQDISVLKYKSHEKNHLMPEGQT